MLINSADAMKQIDAIHHLMRLDDREGAHVFTKNDLRAIFADDEPALNAGINRLVKSRKKGVRPRFSLQIKRKTWSDPLFP